MLSFLVASFRTVIGLVTGTWQTAIQNVLTFLQGLSRTTYLYHSTLYGNVRSQWQRVARASLNATGYMAQFMQATYNQFARLRKVDLPYLERWLMWLGGTLKKLIETDVSLLDRKIDSDYAKNHAYARSILIWVVIHVLGFLYRILASVLGWVAREGNTMWYFFTHLDEFGILLFWHIIAALEMFAWDAGRRLGTFLLSMIIHNVVRFATLVESIIDAVI